MQKWSMPPVGRLVLVEGVAQTPLGASRRWKFPTTVSSQSSTPRAKARPRPCSPISIGDFHTVGSLCDSLRPEQAFHGRVCPPLLGTQCGCVTHRLERRTFRGTPAPRDALTAGRAIETAQG